MPNAKDLVLRLRSITDGFKTDAPVRELDDLEHSLDATGRQARTSAREVKQAAADMDAPGFDKAAAEAENTAARMRAAAEDMAAGMKQGARDIDTETGKIRQDMSAAGSEIGSEFIGNIAEGIGSGSGSVTDVVQGTLGGLTNLASTLTGPVGIAAGTAAAGIGLVFAASKAEAEKAKGYVDTLIGAFEELGETTSEAAQQAAWDAWLDTMKESPETISQIVDALDDAGISGETYRDAITGSRDAQYEVTTALTATRDAINNNLAVTGDLTDEQQDYLDNARVAQDAVNDWNGALDTTAGYYSDIDYLQGEGKGKQGKITDEINRSRDAAKGLRTDLDDATKDRTVNVTINTRDASGRAQARLVDPRTGGNAGAYGGYGR